MSHDNSLTGNYKLIEMIGHGGMGEVWRAEHRMLGREAAVKLIRPDALGAESSAKAKVTLRRFEKEARATAKLRSPHTIELYDFGTTGDGTFYYVMELLEGVDLQFLVSRFGPQPPARVIHLLRQVCESLAEAHHNGLIHRDIKPANVFCCRLGLKLDVAKVLDFGLVKGVPGSEEDSGLTVDGAVPGSPAFMAPEAIRGDMTTDERMDIYSLGCVAYWLLTGERVFTGRTALELVLGHLQKQPKSMIERTDRPIPPALDQLVMSCLSKDPGERPQTVTDLSRTLKSCCDLEPWSEELAEQWWQDQDPVRAREKARDEEAPLNADGTRTLTTASDLAEPSVISAEVVEERLDRMVGEDVDLSRERVVGVLQDQFEQSRIDVHDYDRRSRLAQLAESPDDLKAAVTGLAIPRMDHPPVPVERPAERSAPPPVPAEDAQLPAVAQEDEGFSSMISVFSAAIRKGSWRPAPRTRVVSVFGGAELDFRNAVLQPGMNHFKFVSVFGGAAVIVPPDLYVEVDGFGVFGAFSESGTAVDRPAHEGAPWLKITGVAVFGGVDIKVKAGSSVPQPDRKKLPAP